jgi:protein-tyrosine phosphatase
MRYPPWFVNSILLISSISSSALSGCSTTQKNIRVLNPVAAETPVYRHKAKGIVVDLNQLVPPAQQPVTVYRGYAYDAIDWSQPVAVGKEGKVNISIEERNHQHFFGLVSAGGDTLRTAERLIPMKGTDNFRDLGGYVTTDGRTVKWGLLYRSGDLSDLKPRGQDFFGQLNIRKVIDFRSRENRDHKPDRLPEDKIIDTVTPAVYDLAFTRKQYRKKLQSMKATDNAEAVLIALNRMYVSQFTDSFAVAIRALAIQSGPIQAGLYHCSAGKDRTGFMSALLLTLLGVPRETIMRDYLASNYYRYARIQRRARLAPLVGIRSEVARALLEVHPVYLEEAFRAIEEEYGSMEHYIRQGLRISEEQQATIRKQYLVAQVNPTELDSARKEYQGD